MEKTADEKNSRWYKQPMEKTADRKKAEGDNTNGGIQRFGN